MTGAAIVLVGLLVGGGAFYVGQAFGSDSASLTVQTNDHINNLDSAQIQVHIQHGTADSSYSVTIRVATPTGAGGPFCDVVTITTDGSGNGRLTMKYPGTFTGSACSPAGTGGPSTILPGTYTVTVSSSPAIASGTLTTTFNVLPPKHVVTGAGTIASKVTSTNTFPYPVLCGTAPASTTNAPYFTNRVGSVIFTGVISTTSGQIHSNIILNPCVTPSVVTFNVAYVLDDVTLTLPSGDTMTGGLTLSGFGTSTGIATATTAVTFWVSITSVTGSGGLESVSGVGEIQGSATTVGASNNYWIQLQVGGDD